MKFELELEVGFSDNAARADTVHPDLRDGLLGVVRKVLDDEYVREVFEDNLFDFYDNMVSEGFDGVYPFVVKGLRVLGEEGSSLTKHRVVDKLIEECGCEDAQEPVKRFYIVDKDTGSSVDLNILDFASFLSTRLNSPSNFDGFLVFVDEVSAENSRRYYELLNKTVDSIRDLDGVKLEQVFKFIEGLF